MEEENKISRIFASRVPGSSFIFSGLAENPEDKNSRLKYPKLKGKIIYFRRGWYETSDPGEIEELLQVAGSVPTIFVPEHENELRDTINMLRASGRFTGDYSAIVNAVILPQLEVPQKEPGAAQGVSPAASVDVDASLTAAIKRAGAAAGVRG